MAFSNQTTNLLTDSYSNIYNFLWDNGRIIYIYFDKMSNNNVKKELVRESTMEFDVTIDDEDNIYLVYQEEDNRVHFMVLTDGMWKTIDFVEIEQKNIYNLNIIWYDKKIHIFYCSRSDKDMNIYEMYHYIYHEDTWRTIKLGNIRKNEILNPFQIIEIDNRIMIGYYDVVDNVEQIFIKIFDAIEDKWKDSIQLTKSEYNKLYLDVLNMDNNEVHLTYSELQDGNFVIKYNKYRIINNKVNELDEKILSNPANCSYPTFIYYNQRLWVVWTEYDNLMSSFSNDIGLNWEGPYLWKESKKSDFLRYKFCSNDKNIKDKLNYSFGKIFPSIELIGFGSLDNTLKMPLKKETLNHEMPREKEYENEIKRLQVELEKLNNGFGKIENNSVDLSNLKEIKERIDKIESYLSRRRRGLFF